MICWLFHKWTRWGKPSLQRERSLEEQSIIQEIIERSPFKANPTLHADYVQKKIQEMDMDEKPDATAREWTIFKRHDSPSWAIAPKDGFVYRNDEPKPESIALVEKSAYDALKARVAELETENRE